MISVPDLGDDVHAMWLELFALSAEPPAPWVLIGAQMVDLHGWAHGREPVRPSRDADVLVDVRLVADATARMSHALKERDFELDGVSPEGIGHRLVKGTVSVDVLAPDNVGERVSLRTLGTAETVRVPGGTQALARRTVVDVTSRDIEGTVPIPGLLGAILVKVRAIGIDDSPEAQRRDTAFLLSFVGDHDDLIPDMKRSERGWLRRYPEFADPASNFYADVPNAEDAAIVYRRLSGA